MKKTIAMSVVVLFLTIGATTSFAADWIVASSDGDGNYILKMNDKGVFWIEDNVRGMTSPITTPIIKIESFKTQQSGVYEIVCGAPTRYIVNNAADLFKILTARTSLPTAIATWAGQAIDNGLCDYYKPY
jgi:hypothetical protein